MNGKRKVLIFSVLIIMALAIAGVGMYYWFENTNYVSTEDAQVTGDLVNVTPQISGKLLVFNVSEGQMVQKGQILGRQDLGSLPDSSLEMAIIRAPITGIILKKQNYLGVVVSPGQTLAMMVDSSHLYINANIEETKLERLKPGQVVDVNVDQFPDKHFSGTVDSIGQASSATFSLLPTNTGGTFTKVVQKIPVKITLAKTDVKLLPGTNAVIKIHVK
ncbi:efflux RND transporter periplasmic adaptor subunit [Desulfosporosinus sp. BG]|uniref:HlyD family secretion protein n=1 Tax=Desulfosporosinus sp. BG TaxID=1633135 RepID=UPI00083B5F2B|nr:efflux RND transporter periplasmic adaptor subunit [Desulfosporosinus sp. BG]ODA39469.1 Multidrug resistance efflux pump, EmrA [Desulfosporosinus sp. BG]